MKKINLNVLFNWFFLILLNHSDFLKKHTSSLLKLRHKISRSL